MTIADVEHGQRVEAAAWAQVNGLQFVIDNDAEYDPHAQPTLVWLFKPDGNERLTRTDVEHRGTAEGQIYFTGGSGALPAIQLAESLLELFRGRVYAGSSMLDEARIMVQGREGTSFRVDVVIPWEWHEKRVPQGAVSLYETPGAAIAYQAYRQRWETLVRAPLGLTTYYDNNPPETAVTPFAWNRFRTLQPIGIELQTILVPGRILSALHYPLGTGVADAKEAIDTITNAFDECTHRGIQFGTPLVNRIGRTPSNTWQALVRLPFKYEVRTI